MSTPKKLKKSPTNGDAKRPGRPAKGPTRTLHVEIDSGLYGWFETEVERQDRTKRSVIEKILRHFRDTVEPGTA
jgi:hypothetical protein